MPRIGNKRKINEKSPHDKEQTISGNIRFRVVAFKEHSKDKEQRKNPYTPDMSLKIKREQSGNKRHGQPNAKGLIFELQRIKRHSHGKRPPQIKHSVVQIKKISRKRQSKEKKSGQHPWKNLKLT